MPPVKTLPEIDADLRRVQAAVEGARAALRHCPSAENAEALNRLERQRDAALEARYEQQTDAVVEQSA